MTDIGDLIGEVPPDAQPLPASWRTDMADMRDRLAEIDRLAKGLARIAVTITAVTLLVVLTGCNPPEEPDDTPRGVDYTTVPFGVDPPGSHPVGVNPLHVFGGAR